MQIGIFSIYAALLSFLGKPEAFASSYVNDGTKKYMPSYSIDGEIGDEEKSFKSINEPYPWISIDFGEPRMVDSVTLVVFPSYVLPGYHTS